MRLTPGISKNYTHPLYTLAHLKFDWTVYQVAHITFLRLPALFRYPMQARRMSVEEANYHWIVDQLKFDRDDVIAWSTLPPIYTNNNDGSEAPELSVRFSDDIEISDITTDSIATWSTIREDTWSQTFHPQRPTCPRSCSMPISLGRRTTIYTERPDLMHTYRRGGANDTLYEEWSSLWDASLMDLSDARVVSTNKHVSADMLTISTCKPPTTVWKIGSLSTQSTKPSIGIPLCVDNSLPYWWPIDTATEKSILALFQSTFT